MTNRVMAMAAMLAATVLLGACGGSGGGTTETVTASTPTTSTEAATDTTTEATTDSTTTEATTVESGGEKSQSDLAQQIAACIAENGGDPKIDTLGDRVTIGVRIGPDAEQTVFAVLTDGRNAQNFVDKLIADGADPSTVFYSDEQPVVTYFPEGSPSGAVKDTVNYCVYEYEL